MRMALISRFIRRNDGTTIIEFAVVAPIFFLLIFGVIEYGLFMFSKVGLESVVSQAARTAAIGKVAVGCVDTVCTIRKEIEDKTDGLLKGGPVNISASVISAGEPRTFDPDICIDNNTDTVSSPPTCADPGMMVQEVNGAAGYQGSPPTFSVGGPGDIVEIRASYPWRVQFPFLKEFFGTNGVVLISSSTLIKNE